MRRYRKSSGCFSRKKKQAHREMGGCHNIIKKTDFSRSLTFPSLFFFCVCLLCCPCLYPHVFTATGHDDYSSPDLPGLRYTQQRLHLHLCVVECFRDLLSSSVSVQDREDPWKWIVSTIKTHVKPSFFGCGYFSPFFVGYKTCIFHGFGVQG